MARDIAILESNPVDWSGWVANLLEQMEGEAQRRGKCLDYVSMLEALLKNLQDRIRDSGF